MLQREEPVCCEPKLFVGGLRFDATREEVVNQFQQYGPIKTYVLLHHKDTGKSKGCAMVQYLKWAHAEAAVQQLNGTNSALSGEARPMIVKFADPQRRQEDGMLIGVTPKKLFIGQIPRGITAEQIRSIVAPYGDVLDLNLMPPKRETAMGCAFVTFSTWAAAEQCIEALNGQFTFPGATQHIMVKLADAKPQDMQRVGAKRGMMDMGPGSAKRQMMGGGMGRGMGGGMGGMGGGMGFPGMGMGMNPMMMNMMGQGMGMPGMMGQGMGQGMMGQGMGMMNPGMMGMMNPMGQMGQGGAMGQMGQGGPAGAQGGGQNWQQGGQGGGQGPAGAGMGDQGAGGMQGAAGGMQGQEGAAGAGQGGMQGGGMGGGYSQAMQMGGLGYGGNMGMGMNPMNMGGMQGMGIGMGGMQGMGMGGMGGGMGGGMARMGQSGVMGIGDQNGNLQAAKAWKLFIGQISYDLAEGDLYEFFSQFGTILELVLLRNQSDARHRGCGFLVYNSMQEAEAALAANNTKLPNDIRQRPIMVKFANK